MIRPRLGIKSAITGICTSPLAATQHRPRLLAPARQLVRRRDQRLLPRRVFNQIAPASHRSGTAVRSERIHSGGNYKPGIQPSAWNTAPPDISLFAVTTPAYLSPPWARFASLKWQTRYPAICVAYGTAGHQFACSDHPGLSESAAGEVCRLKVANQVSGHPRGIRHRRASVCLQ